MSLNSYQSLIRQDRLWQLGQTNVNPNPDLTPPIHRQGEQTSNITDQYLYSMI